MVRLISSNSAPNETSTSALAVNAYRMPMESLEKLLNMSHLYTKLRSRFTRNNALPRCVRRPGARTDGVQHALGHVVDRNHLVHCVECDSLARHAEYHAA